MEFCGLRTFTGEGAVSLARPFIAAGVPLVLASLWPVESNATADLMISFHQHRKEKTGNNSTVNALRLAQLEAIRKPNAETDFGWAAFVAIGGYAEF
jgi:CHAT domain-containing protein